MAIWSGKHDSNIRLQLGVADALPLSYPRNSLPLPHRAITVSFEKFS